MIRLDPHRDAFRPRNSCLASICSYQQPSKIFFHFNVFTMHPCHNHFFLLRQLKETVKSLQQPQNMSSSSSAAAEPTTTSAFDSREDLSFLLQSLDWIPEIRVSKHCRFPLLIAKAAEVDPALHWHWPHAAAFIAQHQCLYDASSLTSLSFSPSPPNVDPDSNISDAAADNFSRGFPVSVVLDHRQSHDPSAQSTLLTRFCTNFDPTFAASTLSVNREVLHRGVDVATRAWNVEEGV
jgi:hypothetical protein